MCHVPGRVSASVPTTPRWRQRWSARCPPAGARDDQVRRTRLERTSPHGCWAHRLGYSRQGARSGGAFEALDVRLQEAAACRRVMTRSTGCVHSVATAPEAQPATKSAVFSAIKRSSHAVAARRPEQGVKTRGPYSCSVLSHMNLFILNKLHWLGPTLYVLNGPR